MKGLSLVILAGALAAGVGALAYKKYLEKKAEREAEQDDELIDTEIEIICGDDDTDTAVDADTDTDADAE